MGIDNRYERSEITDKIIGLAIKVHKVLGPGFPERFYAKALVYELSKNKIRYCTEKNIHIKYGNLSIGVQRLDLIIEDVILVELKAVTEINEIHIAQAVSYLKASDVK